MKQKANEDRIAQIVSELLLEINAVSFRFNPPYTFTSGLKSPIYLDNRLILSYPMVREKIINLYLQVILQHIGMENIDYLSGTATSAIPHVSWIAGKLNLPLVYSRGSRKDYGKGKMIEGYLKPGSNVVIIEDHISTGGSSIVNAESVREEGGIVKYCVVTTTYETKVAAENLKKHKIKLISLTTGRKIVQAALKKGLLKKNEHDSVQEWFKDQNGWYKKHYA